MKKELTFKVPFSGFTTVNFINCFTSVYMHLEGIDLGGIDYDCAKMRGKGCSSCGNCSKGGSTPAAVQEKFVFLFDTVCGRSALRCRFDGEPTEMQKRIGETEADGCGTDYTAEFLFGFAGYEYRKCVDSAVFRDEITASVDTGRPVIAKVRAGDGRFRVITGYDGKKLLEPDYKGAQKVPKKAVRYDELESLYIIGGKTAPRYLALDALERIAEVMEYNQNKKLWDGYTERMDFFGYHGKGFETSDNKEKAARMKRVADTMWHTFNCHNFAEVFRKYRGDGDPVYDNIGDMKRLRDPALKALWDQISGPCNGYTHDLAWALIGLEQCADWKRHAAGYFGEMAQLTLYQIQKNDEEALGAIKRAVELLRSGDKS